MPALFADNLCGVSRTKKQLRTQRVDLQGIIANDAFDTVEYENAFQAGSVGERADGENHTKSENVEQGL